MRPLAPSIGLGKIVDYEWIVTQQVTDELGALKAIPHKALK
jgi:hypothetical protein